MTYAAAFAPLLVAWAILHRAAGRRTWGFVGCPTQQREAWRAATVANREIIRTLRRLTATANEFTAKLALLSVPAAEASARITATGFRPR